MRVELVPVDPENEEAFRNLTQFWHYDFSEIFEPQGADVGADGSYALGRFDRHLSDPRYEKFLARVDDELAGLAVCHPTENGAFLDRFFVLRKYRRRSVGREAARRMFDSRPGTWALTVRPFNTNALAFWRRTLPQIAEDLHEDEQTGEDGIVRIRFDFRIRRG